MSEQVDRDGNVWHQLSITLGCSGCGKNTTVFSETTCGVCGMMLCGNCGNFCKHHHNADIIARETSKVVVEVWKTVNKHRRKIMICCQEDCWCWEMESLANELTDRYINIIVSPPKQNSDYGGSLMEELSGK